MSMTDPIADFITRIRNSTMRKHATVESPGSNVRVEIAKVLKKEGFIEDWLAFDSEKGLPRIMVTLKYDAEGDSILRGIKRISRPGLRLQTGYRNLPTVLNGQGIAVISTSKGVMTDFDCREQKVGGEILCHVW